MVNRTVVSSALKIGFDTGEVKNGQPVIDFKTITLFPYTTLFRSRKSVV